MRPRSRAIVDGSHANPGAPALVLGRARPAPTALPQSRHRSTPRQRLGRPALPSSGRGPARRRFAAAPARRRGRRRCAPRARDAAVDLCVPRRPEDDLRQRRGEGRRPRSCRAGRPRGSLAAAGRAAAPARRRQRMRARAARGCPADVALRPVRARRRLAVTSAAARLDAIAERLTAVYVDPQAAQRALQLGLPRVRDDAAPALLDAPHGREERGPRAARRARGRKRRRVASRAARAGAARRDRRGGARRRSLRDPARLARWNTRVEAVRDGRRARAGDPRRDRRGARGAGRARRPAAGTRTHGAARTMAARRAAYWRWSTQRARKRSARAVRALRAQEAPTRAMGARPAGHARAGARPRRERELALIAVRIRSVAILRASGLVARTPFFATTDHRTAPRARAGSRRSSPPTI